MTKTHSEWLRELGAFMHANGHPFDGDELEEVASALDQLSDTRRRVAEVEAALVEAHNRTDFFSSNATFYERKFNDGKDRLTALRNAADGLLKALSFAGKRCCEVHHDKRDQHGSMDDCPVEARITKAMAAYAALISDGKKPTL